VPLRDEKRDVPRVWEVDWAIPAAEGGTLWDAYPWALDTAAELDVDEVTIVGSTYEVLGRLDRAIGSAEAGRLRVQPHGYRVGGITVRGVTRRGYWYAKGVVLAAWASHEVLAEIEGHRPDAIAAVADWPDTIATWRSVYSPSRIGQVRPEQEAEYDTAGVASLDPRAARAIRVAGGFVNENHSVLSKDEREAVAGALVALRAARIPVDTAGLRALLMASGWNGRLVNKAIELADRVERGETPHHRPFSLAD
jgi:hypothetical protein